MRNKILQHLHDNAMSQADLARAIGVKRQYLNDYLTGKADSVKLEILCRKELGL